MIQGLYAITPEHVRGDALFSMVREALEGGARAVQYRAKGIPGAIARTEASTLASMCSDFDALLVVNDGATLARDVHAGAVHIGRTDGTIEASRRIVGADVRIGVSCYDRLDLAREAARGGADYVAFGSFFPSVVKPHAVRPEPSLLTEARTSLKVPVVAIGGITIQNASCLIEAGADAIAVITGLFGAKDVRARAAEFVALFADHRRDPT